jgi:magnesium chelatase subunit D
MRRVVLPFTAIVGQKKLKQALLLNAVNPGLLGVLIRGQKGTAKSTAVRALADLLPEIDVVKCRFNCSPDNPSLQCSTCHDRCLRGEEMPVVRRKMKVVELPLGATEDRVTGALDIERALREGIKALEPGILAEVNQGILYIDEVNLLDDHLVDVLLDSAAMGVNTVEREGVSVSHPSKFILVGTMNPEEGELRPQLLDRFGLSLDIEGTRDVAERIEIIKVVEEFERHPESFPSQCAEEQEALRLRILRARQLVNEVEISEALLRTVAAVCMEFEVHGHRADFLIARAARTLAAYNDRKHVIEQDLREAAELVLPHRVRRLPFEEAKPIREKLDAIIRDSDASIYTDSDDENTRPVFRDPEDKSPAGERGPKTNQAKPISPGRKAKIEVDKDSKQRTGSGRRARTLSSHSGKYVTARIPEGKSSDIAIDATIRASAARKGALGIEKEDLREKVRAKKVASIVVFVVDASGSMAALRGMEMAKRAVLALLEDSYQKRDKVAFIAVAGDKARVLLPPTSSVEMAARHLRELPTGGKTPLSDGLLKGLQVLKTERWKRKNIVPIMVLVSDGRGNVPIAGDSKREAISIAEEIGKQGIHLVVIDSDDGFLSLGYGREIVDAGRGQYFKLDELDSDRVVDLVRSLEAIGEDADSEQ